MRFIVGCAQALDCSGRHGMSEFIAAHRESTLRVAYSGLGMDDISKGHPDRDMVLSRNDCTEGACIRSLTCKL